MNELTTITTARVSVPNGTTFSAPQSLIIYPQNQILKSLKIVFAVASNTVGFHAATGWRVSNNGRLLIPSIGSVDEVTNIPYGGVPSFGEFLNFDDLNIPLEGPPYDLKFEFYNTGGVAVTYYIYATTTPKIELPAAPIVADIKEK